MLQIVVTFLVTEQRANIKYCLKGGKTATENFQILKQVYGNSALFHTRVFEWYARFRNGRGNLERLRTHWTTHSRSKPDMIEIVRELISTDHLMTLRMIEEELEIIRETIRKIVVENLR